jgi:hypothetical protein
VAGDLDTCTWVRMSQDWVQSKRRATQRRKMKLAIRISAELMAVETVSQLMATQLLSWVGNEPSFYNKMKRAKMKKEKRRCNGQPRIGRRVVSAAVDDITAELSISPSLCQQSFGFSRLAIDRDQEQPNSLTEAVEPSLRI